MQLGRLEQTAEPEAKPARRCSVAGCDAADVDICGVWGKPLCYRHVAEFVAEHPDSGKESLAAWLSKARAA